MKDVGSGQAPLSQKNLISLLLEAEKLKHQFPSYNIQEQLLNVARVVAHDQERRVQELLTQIEK